MNTKEILENKNFRNNQNYVLSEKMKRKVLPNLIKTISNLNYYKATKFLEYDIWKIKLSYIKVDILEYKLIHLLIYWISFCIFLFFLFLLLKFNNLYFFILLLLSLLFIIIYFLKINNNEMKKGSYKNYNIFIDNKYLYYSKK